MKRLHKISFAVIIGIYIIILLMLLLRMNVTNYSLASDVQDLHIKKANIIPFRGILEILRSFSGNRILSEIFGNIIIFVPMGLYLKCGMKKYSDSIMVLIVLFSSLGIEILQYVFEVGYFDVDDIILNTLGGSIGILLYGISSRLLKRKQYLLDITLNVISWIVGFPIFCIVIIVIFNN